MIWFEDSAGLIKAWDEFLNVWFCGLQEKDTHQVMNCFGSKLSSIPNKIIGGLNCMSYPNNRYDLSLMNYFLILKSSIN